MFIPYFITRNQGNPREGMLDTLDPRHLSVDFRGGLDNIFPKKNIEGQ